MGKTTEHCKGIVVLDKAMVTSTGEIYAYLYTDKDDELVAITDEKILSQLRKELRKKLGRCSHPRHINTGDTTGTVLSFSDFIQECYSTQMARDYDDSRPT